MMSTIINKKRVRDILSEQSKRNQIGQDVVPYINTICKRLVYALIDVDNSRLSPEDEKTLTKDAVNDALSVIDDAYGLSKLSDVEKDVQHERIALSGNIPEHQTVDLNLNITLSKDDNEEV